MLTRRKFIQSNMLGMAAPLARGKEVAAIPQSQSAGMVSPARAREERDYWNYWPDYITAQMNEARARRLTQLQSMRN